MQTLIKRLLPFVALGMFIILTALGFILFAYLFLIGLAIGMVLFIIQWIRFKLIQYKVRTKPIQTTRKRKNRIIDVSDWKRH